MKRLYKLVFLALILASCRFVASAKPPQVFNILNTQDCPLALRRGLPVMSQSTPFFPLSWNTTVAMDVVRKSYASLARMNDQVVIGDPVLGNRGKVCVGIYEDGNRPNALAIGSDTILFGKSLFTKLSSKKDTNWKLSLVLLHEYAHILQSTHKLDYRVGQGNQVLKIGSTKRKALVADCAAGTLLSYQYGSLLPLGALQEVHSLFQYLGDSHSLGDHGKSCLRAKAFSYGFAQKNIVDKSNPFYYQSGPLLQNCQKYTDQPQVLWGKCDH